MYDPTGGDTNHEWIELENTGDSAVDISGWKLFEGTSNHSLASILGGTEIAPHSFAVIADNAATFQLDWPQMTGVLFDSVFSLSNAGESISIKDSTGAVVDEITYTAAAGATGDGNSLAGSGQTWTATIPTPGSAKQNGSISNEDDGENSGSDTNDNTDESGDVNDDQNGNNSTNVASKKITANIVLPPSVIFFDASATLSLKVTMPNGTPADHGWVYWNFGDGESYTAVNTDPAIHIFAYSGKYVVQANYYENYYDRIPTASHKIAVSVAAPKIELSDNGLTISMKNAGKSEMDISEWKIQEGSALNAFTFPINTYLLAGSTVILEKKKIGLIDADEYILMYPNGLKAASTADSIIEDVKPVEVNELVPEAEAVAEVVSEAEILPAELPEQIIAVEEVPAPQTTQAEQAKPKSKMSSRIVLLMAGVVSMAAFISMLFSGGGSTEEDTIS
ncbi:MAG: lamin tail domain-containing protein [Candidatus Pacebacteria bacterium]|nr:lamin tail domain-containing protein [Candidatus Paceibacterota bacterium]